MKKLLVVSAVAVLGLNVAAFAGGLPEEMPMAPAATVSEAGIYLGIEGGYAMAGWKYIEASSQNGIKFSKDNGIVGRAFVGWDINKYFAIEAGYSYFLNKAKLEIANSHNDITTMIVDLFGKLKAPINDEVNLYGKLGPDLVFTKASKSGSNPSLINKNSTNFNLAYGAGIDWSITSNIILNLEWLRHNDNAHSKDFIFAPDGQKKSARPFTDSFMVGLRYKWDI